VEIPLISRISKLSLAGGPRALVESFQRSIFASRVQQPFVSSPREKGGTGRKERQPGGGDGVEAICLSRADSFRLQTRRIVCEGAPSPLENSPFVEERRACRRDKGTRDEEEEAAGGGAVAAAAAAARRRVEAREGIETLPPGG